MTEEFEQKIVSLKVEIANYFLHNYDSEMWDGTMQELVNLLDKVQHEERNYHARP